MKTQITITFLVIILAACTPARTNTTDVQNTAIVAAWTGLALTQTALPAATPTVVTVTPSPLPTQPIIPIITPDAIQVERWKEYETALARSLFSSFTPEVSLCEWEILGRSGQEVYVWAVCEILGGDEVEEHLL